MIQNVCLHLQASDATFADGMGLLTSYSDRQPSKDPSTSVVSSTPVGSK
jgi:hypothetical protein